MTTSKNYFSQVLVVFIFLIASFSIMVSCNEEARGFALPEGNPIIGKVLFMDLKCNECHSISDVQWLGNVEDLHVGLGGDVRIMKSYGELVSSVINPSHKIAKRYYEDDNANEDGSSKMKNYNELMTVQELVDLVTFLQSEYSIERPIYHYPMY